MRSSVPRALTSSSSSINFLFLWFSTKEIICRTISGYFFKVSFAKLTTVRVFFVYMKLFRIPQVELNKMLFYVFLENSEIRNNSRLLGEPSCLTGDSSALPGELRVQYFFITINKNILVSGLSPAFSGFSVSMDTRYRTG